MSVKLINKIPIEELIKKIRQVPLIKPDSNGNSIYVYSRADISLRRMHPEEVNPTTLYLLKDGLDFQRRLRDTLMSEHQIDSLSLDCALELKNESGEIWTLTPPIIEVANRQIIYHPIEGHISYSGSFDAKLPVINDGAHRVYLARELGVNFNAIFIGNIPREHPFYAHPNSWEDVRIVNSIPKTKAEKKLYLMEDCYALYRDFGVLGCGKPRGTGK